MTASQDDSLLFPGEIDDEKQFEIDSNDVVFGEPFGDILFSKTHRGELKVNDIKIPVIIKSAANPKDATQNNMISAEIVSLMEIKRHPTILEFVGVATIEEQPSIIFEYPDGDNLLEFVRNSRQKGTFNTNLDKEDNGFVLLDTSNGASLNQQSLNAQRSLCTADLISIALQIAKGMEYLTSLAYVHRQLRLKNIFIKYDKTIRIGEFGLARKNGKLYYRIIHQENPLPHHWMAPENFKDHKFTEKSEVWSYAVTLWELFTLGDVPYDKVEDMLKYLEVRRLPQPGYCSKEIYDFMKKCWDKEPSKRPTFSECVKFFEEQMRQQTTEQETSQRVGNNN